MKTQSALDTDTHPNTERYQRCLTSPQYTGSRIFALSSRKLTIFLPCALHPVVPSSVSPLTATSFAFAPQGWVRLPLLLHIVFGAFVSPRIPSLLSQHFSSELYVNSSLPSSIQFEQSSDNDQQQEHLKLIQIEIELGSCAIIEPPLYVGACTTCKIEPAQILTI